MAETLGEKLRAAREERGISISEVAEQTRIAPMYIENIENDNYKPLPGGIFNKGFVKSYARFIGMDEQEALNDYSRLIAQTEGQQSQEEQFKTYRPEVLTDDRATQSTLPTIIVAGVILALMTAGILFLVNYLQNQPSDQDVATNTASINQNTVRNEQPAQEGPASGSPSMQNLRVEFRTASEPIWLSATSDGKTSVTTVTAANPQTFEPKESIRLSYSKSLAASAQLFLNGKQITLPSQPANPKRVPIEIEISSNNLEEVWRTGEYSYGVSQPSSATQPPAASPTPRPASAAQSNSNRPSTTAVNRPRPTQTPIIAGRPTNSASPRSTPN